MVSTIVLLASWASIFGLTLLMIFKLIPRNDLFTWGFILIYLILALFAQTWRDMKPKK